MSVNDSVSNAVKLRDIDDDDKMLAFSFLRYIQDMNLNKDSIEAIVHLVSEAFAIDAAGAGGKNDADVDLRGVFLAALKQKSGNTAEEDAKFKSFLEVLDKKNYFKGVESGSEEYKERVEKAHTKFMQRNNPFEGLSPAELKSKGNTLMSQNKYKEAIQYYTHAIEVDPQNYICYANRAAAHLHLNDYAVAIIDCEKAIQINDSYPKAYGRLGTAYYYSGKYSESAEAFRYACKLEPDNQSYMEDLKRAEEHREATAAPSIAGGDASSAPGGFPGLPGGMDLSSMMDMMKNPAFTGMMEKMMSNPQMAEMAQNMAGKMMSGGGFPGMPGGMPGIPEGPPQFDENGSVITPFGKMDKQKLDKLRDENMNNDKMKAVMDDVHVNGMGAFYKHMNDPEVMKLMMKFNQEMLGGMNESEEEK